MAAAGSNTIHVLHVDDDPEFAALAADFVERQEQPIKIETTTNPDDALDYIRTEGVHCVVSDYDMPEQSGIEFLKAVREEFPDLPFILYTGKGSEEVATEAIHAGVTDYLQKASGTSQYEVLANRIRNAVEQHRAQEFADETQHRLQTLAEHTNDILWMFTGDWNELLFINSPYEEIWGRSVDELRERPQSFLAGIHPEDRDSVTQAMDRLSSGDSVDLEYRVNAEEDFGRWVWVQGEPVFDDAGNVEKVAGFARDITDRRARQEEIEQLKDRFQAFTEFASDVIAVVDENGRIQYESPSAKRVLGYEPEELIGKSAFEHIHPDDREELIDTFEAVLGSPGSVTERATYRFKHADGSWIWLETVGSNRTNSAINGYVVISRDITEQVERERQLATREETLRRLYEITANEALTVSEQIESLLSVTREAMSTDYATFSHIQDAQYEFEVVDVADGIDLRGGTTTDRTELPICERVYETGAPLVLNDVESEAEELVDPTWGIACYIGAPVLVDGEPYGTFCFYDVEPRSEPFTEWEQTIVEFLGNWVGLKLTQAR